MQFKDNIAKNEIAQKLNKINIRKPQFTIAKIVIKSLQQNL